MKFNDRYTTIPVYQDTETQEIGKYCDLYTDIWNFEILMSLEDLQSELEKVWEWYFRFKKLEEYSKILEHHTELCLDMSKTKVLWFREHILTFDKIKQAELEKEKTLSSKK